MIRNILLFTMLMSLSIWGMGQDIHFSQFQSSPLNLNPALTGVMDHSSRAVLNYRSQWASFLGPDAFNTISASYDMQFELGRSGSDYVGVGGVLYGDFAGEVRLSTVYGALSGSYSKRLAGTRSSSHYLIGGAAVGFGQRSLSTDNLRWPSQFRNGVFDQGQGSAVPLNGDPSATFLDIGGGLMWLYSFNRSSNVQVGVSAAHINEPEVQFLDGVSASGNPAQLNRRLIGHAAAEIELTDQLYIMPFGMYASQGEISTIMGGSAVRLMLSPAREENQSIDLGLYGRFVNNFEKDADNVVQEANGMESLIFMAKINFPSMALGFSYDYNVSTLEAASRGHGAFEVSLQFFGNNGIARGANAPRF